MRCLLLLVAPFAFGQNCAPTPPNPRQGDLIRLACGAGVAEARMSGKTIRLFPAGEGRPGELGLMPVAADAKPGLYRIDLLDSSGKVVHTVDVTVRDAHFPAQNVTMSQALADLEASPGEMDTVGAFTATVSDRRYWGDSFVAPVPGCVTSPFGVQRLRNGRPTGHYHTGLDQRTPLGHPVRAFAGGVVRLVRSYNIHGKVVGVDHGQGLVSLYLHLSRFAVKEGDVVKAGDVLGYAGSTGRSTAPHLHWNVEANGVPVNPTQWISVKPCPGPSKSQGRRPLTRRKPR